MQALQNLERLVEAIERQGANIAPTYQEYMPIAFAIANDCGEAGRSLFHRICRLSEKYAGADADRLFDHALKSGDGRNGLGTVFHLAEVAGVKAMPQSGTPPPESKPETFKLSNFQPPLTHTHAHEGALPRFNGWGLRWKRLLDALGRTANLIQLRLSDAQKELFNQRFAQLFGHAAQRLDGAMRSTVARIAINTCRLCSIVALLRSTETLLSPDRETPDEIAPADLPGLSPAEEIPAENVRDGIVPKLDLRVTDDDFHAVLALVEPLYRHSAHVLRFLPSSEVEVAKRSPEQAWLNDLPLSFTRAQAVEEAAKRGMPKNTTDTLLRRMVEKGILVKSERGGYLFASRVCVREGQVKV